MTTLFYLLRHASHGHVGRVLTGRKPGAPLTDRGREEAQALARHLASIKPDTLYTSPQRRARETAAIVGQHIGIESEIAPELDEIDFGRWAGLSFAELAVDPAWRQWNEERDTASTPAGDTMRNAADRLAGFMDLQRRRFAGGRVALVSHSDVIKAAICHYRAAPFQTVHAFEIGPASITTIAVDESGGRVIALNAKAASASAEVPA